MTKQEISKIKIALNDEYEYLQKKILGTKDEAKKKKYAVAQAELIKIEILLEDALKISLD